jgi:hypothetical protein
VVPDIRTRWLETVRDCTESFLDKKDGWRWRRWSGGSFGILGTDRHNDDIGSNDMSSIDLIIST